MKISKRFKRSTLELSILILLFLDITWWSTRLISCFCILYFLAEYLWYRREAKLNRKASEPIHAGMTLSSIKEIERTYTMRDDYNTPEKRALVRPPLDRHFYHQRYAQVRNLLDRYARNARTILDVGCGFGKNTAYIAHSLGRRAVGIDIDSLKLVEAARRLDKTVPAEARSFTGGSMEPKGADLKTAGVPTEARSGEACSFVCADAVQPPFRASTFDCILMTEVLEHLISPAGGLNACRCLLREGGLLIITTPGSHNLDYSNNPFLLAEKLSSLFSDRVLPPYHNLHAERELNHRKPEPQYGIHYHFSIQQLETLIEDAGFETISRGSFEFEIYPYLLVELLARGDVDGIAKWVSPIEALLQRIPVIHLLGQHLLWVARKKPDHGR
jgi:SAM-dependent methyltransferase